MNTQSMPRNTDHEDAVEAHLSRSSALAAIIHSGESFQAHSEEIKDLVSALLADEIDRAKTAFARLSYRGEDMVPAVA